jgi:filamentous hemagglutinin family protein
VASSAFALPSDGDVVSGSASIRQVDPLSMQIYQTSDKAIVNWRGFSIAQGETLQFLQPGADAISLNRVLGSDPSSIFGQLSANGHVFLVNPNGVLFGPSASVNVGGFVASTLTIRDEDFLAGRYAFTAEGYAGSVVNQGQLTAAEGGYVSLIGTHVINDGVITARLGTVALGAGQRLTLDFTGDDLIRVAVDEAAVDSLVANGNLISAEGGRVFLNAGATNGLLNTVLNVDGVIEATSLSEHNGVIRLDGGSSGVVAVSGRLDASGGQGQTGGTVAVLGDKVGLFDGAAIDVSGGVGGGAVFIGGNFQGQGPEANARYTYVDAGAGINADAGQEGSGGQVVVWADEITRFAGLISARGGATSGDGGFVEVSGKEGLVYQGLTDLRADRGNNGTLLLDPRNVNIALGGLDVIALADAFSELLTTDVTFAPLDLQLALNLGNVTLQASNDITLSNPVTTLGLLTNNDLTLEAGRSITITADLSLRGSFTASANVSDPAVVEGDRTAGTTATFTMADGVTIDTSVNDGDITIDMSTGDPAGVGFNSGDITIANLDAGAGNVLINQGGQTAGSDIVRTANSLITANSVALDIGNAGNTTGSIGASGTAINVEVTNLEARTQGGDIFVSSPTQGVNIGSAGLGGLTGFLTNGGNASLTAAGTITDSEAVIVTGTATFLAGAGNDIVLDAPTNDFGALSIASGNNVTLVDANALDLGASTIAGNLVVTTAGALTDSGALSVAGITALAAGAANDITLDSALNDFLGAVSVSSGRNVTLVDTNALDLGASTIAGNLLALAGGPITLSGPLSVGGTTDLISLIADDVDSISNQLDSAVATVQGTLPDALPDPLGGLPPLPPLDTPPIDLPPIIEPPGGTTDTSDVLNIKNRDCEELILTERQSYVCREKSAKRPASPDE